MRLLSLQSLWLAALIVPLVVLYVLKVRRRRLRVPSTWLWAEAKRDLLARSPFKRLVTQLPLILQILVIALLAIAAARPATSGRTLVGDHVAIIVDTSASMAAQDGDSTRIERAKQVAHDLVKSLPPGSDAMILDAGKDARVALPPDRDTRRMHAAIDRLAAREVEGDVAASIALAVNRLKQQGGSRRIYLVSDGNFARPTPLEVAVPMQIMQVGEEAENAAIVRVDVRAGIDPALDKEQVQAFLLVANYGKKARELFVTMKQSNASDTLASRKVLVPAGEKLPVVLTFHPTPGDYGTGLLFELSPHDGLAIDDRAFGRVPSGRKLPVVIGYAKEPSPWLERAISSDPDTEVKTGKLDDVLASDFANEAFIVVDGACPPSPPGGDLLIVGAPEGECFGAKVGKELEKPLLTSWSSADARMRFISLDGVFVAKGRLVEPESKRQELIASNQGTIAADISTSARYATLLGFDVAESDWPYRASFVVFLRNVLEQARLHRSSGIAGPASAGDPLRVSLPPAVTQADVLLESARAEGDAGAKPQKIAVRDGLAIVPEVERAGLYRVRWKDTAGTPRTPGPRAGTVVVPVNLTSADESDLSRKPKAASSTVQVQDAQKVALAPEEHAWLLGLAALAFVLFDIWYLTRGRRLGAATGSLGKGAA
jgi:hypothetical protein